MKRLILFLVCSLIVHAAAEGDIKIEINQEVHGCGESCDSYSLADADAEKVQGSNTGGEVEASFNTGTEKDEEAGSNTNAEGDAGDGSITSTKGDAGAGSHTSTEEDANVNSSPGSSSSATTTKTPTCTIGNRHYPYGEKLPLMTCNSGSWQVNEDVYSEPDMCSIAAPVESTSIWGFDRNRYPSYISECSVDLVLINGEAVVSAKVTPNNIATITLSNPPYDPITCNLDSASLVTSCSFGPLSDYSTVREYQGSLIFVAGGTLHIEASNGISIVTVSPDLGLYHRYSNANDVIEGLCGNHNGNKDDDRVTRTGAIPSSADELIQSWKTEGYTGVCSVDLSLGSRRRAVPDFKPSKNKELLQQGTA